MPLDSGPLISVMRPRGKPPVPNARSSFNDPVGIKAGFVVAILLHSVHDDKLDRKSYRNNGKLETITESVDCPCAELSRNGLLELSYGLVTKATVQIVELMP